MIIILLDGSFLTGMELTISGDYLLVDHYRYIPLSDVDRIERE